jgi:hydrogenase expression/formation protein HypC
MCYAIPAKIIKKNKENATVDYGGIIKEINLSLIEAEIGDYVLIHAGFAIEKLDTESAEQSLQIIRNQIDETEKSLKNG